MAHSINEAGLAEIEQFLSVNHRNWNAIRTKPGYLHAWAIDAEIRMEEGYPPVIKLAEHDSVSGKEVSFTISDDGLDEIEHWDD